LGSIFRIWGIWEYLWPLVVLALAIGFLVTAVFVRNRWLMIPAIIIGMNGLIFQFCAITGLWDWWSILWTLEPFSVGLALLAASGGTRPRLIRAGLIVCVTAVGFFSLMSFVLSGWVSVVGAVLLILAGAGLIAQGRAPLVLKEKSPDEKLADGYM
jgi:membrane protein YdbS with pleckstrin-like domain